MDKCAKRNHNIRKRQCLVTARTPKEDGEMWAALSPLNSPNQFVANTFINVRRLSRRWCVGRSSNLVWLAYRVLGIDIKP